MKKTGACGSVINLFRYEFNHKIEVETGVLQPKCEKILKRFFFRELRDNKKKKLKIWSSIEAVITRLIRNQLGASKTPREFESHLLRQLKKETKMFTDSKKANDKTCNSNNNTNFCISNSWVY